jgi:Ca-activated chloride channel family protein
MNEAIALFSTTENKCIPLISTRIDGGLHDLMSNITVEQIFRNTEPRAIEAVYTFPLPHRAELMGLEVRIGERILEGVVQPASDASERYEEAISDGDGAILLEKISDGDNLYTMNVGNIRPDETVVVRFEYALLSEMEGNQLRLSIPTTVSPRYGNPHRAGFDPHQIPETDLTVEHRYSFTLRISGLFETARVECPTHRITECQTETATEITLEGGLEYLDRDLVLNIYPDQTVTATATCDRDFEGYAVMASFVPFLPAFESRPHDIRIVVDCSGSMGGDSIRQAAIALKAILDELRPIDSFNITLFGSDYYTLFPDPVKASKGNIAKARKLVRGLKADMGGTEMEKAIRATCKMRRSAYPAEVLLITDGEIYEYEKIVYEVFKAWQRVFSVGVGSGVAEAFVRDIAAKTGGAAEFVTPNEDMARHIVRQFQRIYSPVAKARVIWPEGVTGQNPDKLPVLYSGDTLHVFGRGREFPAGNVVLELEVHDTTIRQTAPIVPLGSEETIPSTLARLAAGKRLEFLESDERTELAVRYQLMTEQTSYIVIDKREADEQTEGEPEIRKVPQMLTAGWGGSSTVESAQAVPSPQRLNFFSESKSIESIETSMMDDICDLGIEEPEKDIFELTPWDKFCSNIVELLNRGEYYQLRISDLADLGVKQWIVELLKSLGSAGYAEEEILSAFLFKLARLRLKDRVDKFVISDLKNRQPTTLPPGLAEVLTSLIKAIEKDMDEHD